HTTALFDGSVGGEDEKPPPRAIRPAPRQGASTPPSAQAAGGWRIQVGAFGDPANARRAGAQAATRFPGRRIFYERAGNLTKVLVGPFASSAEATRACGSFSPCVPTRS
ncbi:SPOR domain-containing protein, partial [Sphingomonas turrisvirgatae]|uniref:SPOR domain-containing protein n=1 Tax=Sphingomonas turrisvirgatae TaxID=1888892 RepID=UPI00104262CF